MNWDIWSVFIVIFIVQGFFLLSVLLFSSTKRAEPSNWYLSFIVLIFIWYLAEFFAVRNVLKINFNLFYGTRYGSWMLLGPLTFFFFKSITNRNWKFSKQQLWHFLPFLLFVILIPILSNQSLSHRQIHYGMLAVFDHRPKIVTPFEYLYSTIFYLQFIHLAIYLFFNLRIIKNYAQNLKAEYANINHLIWLRIFNIFLIATLLFASFYLYLLFASQLYKRSLDYIYVLPMGFFIYAVVYRITGINWLKVDPSINRYQKSSLKKATINTHVQQLEKLMHNEKPYLNNTLRLKQLAESINLSVHHLSQVINEHYNCSYFDFINQYRVKTAKQLIQQHPQWTLLQVAFEAGFNNKTSFVNAFKKFDNRTPSQFRKSVISQTKK